MPTEVNTTRIFTTDNSYLVLHLKQRIVRTINIETTILYNGVFYQECYLRTIERIALNSFILYILKIHRIQNSSYIFIFMYGECLL